MDQMSNAAKVGQLFVVTFPGSEVADDSEVVELIRDYHVGGVLLKPENDNIINEGEEDTLAQVATLVNELQSTAWMASRWPTPTVEATNEGDTTNPFVPLFVAINQEGNGMPHSSIVNGTTPLPSAMSLGATWNVSHTETVGQIVGEEMDALGINLLLGPSLDVLEIPRPESAGDIGVRAFGGEPFWVGQMGAAYIRGVHTGSQGEVAVIAKHFPGLGASDRSLNEEIPTVQRTLEKLKQIDLAPFLTATQAEDPQARPDGMVVSHIRFRGLEGGRFVTTRPVSVDSQVLQRLLALPELSTWREAGGVTVSDELGLRALQRFYDPNEQSFNNRRIAQEAFLAGNDVLLLSGFALTDDWDTQMENIKSTISFFLEKYESEPTFQTLVDAAVARILRLKLGLYDGTFLLTSTHANAGRISEQVGQQEETIAGIARDGVTLLSPPSSDLVPTPPTPEDSITIFTDGRTGSPCASCAPQPFLDPLKLRDTILRLYGPDATGQVNPALVSSFTFEQLNAYMDLPPSLPQPSPTPGENVTPVPPNPIETALQRADWVIFAMLDPMENLPQSAAVRRFLAERADTLRNAQLIVLAFDAPYYLDATEISKLSAYYVAYNHTEPFIVASVRTLFGEFASPGTPPVSVPGINYDLLTQTAPDPQQTITVYLEGQPQAEQLTPEPPKLEVGDEIELHTNVIVDHNGNPVPDGTPIQFIFTYPQEGLEHSITATTREGIAQVTNTLDRTGQLDISIQADPYPRTTALQITIQEGGPAIIVPITPTPQPTLPLPTPTPTSAPPVEVEATPQPTPQATPDGGEIFAVEEDAGFWDLLLGLLGIMLIAGTGYYVARLNHQPTHRSLRLALWAVIGGLALYLAYALRLPGAPWLREQAGIWAAGGAALLGGLVPLIITWIMERRKRSSASKRSRA